MRKTGVPSDLDGTYFDFMNELRFLLMRFIGDLLAQHWRFGIHDLLNPAQHLLSPLLNVLLHFGSLGRALIETPSYSLPLSLAAL